MGGLLLGLGLGVAGFLTLVLLASVMAVSLCGHREQCLLEEEGREEGREEGWEEGREEGRQECREEGREKERVEGRQEGREVGESLRRVGRWLEGRKVLLQGGAGRREKDYIECI